MVPSHWRVWKMERVIIGADIRFENGVAVYHAGDTGTPEAFRELMKEVRGTTVILLRPGESTL